MGCLMSSLGVTDTPLIRTVHIIVLRFHLSKVGIVESGEFHPLPRLCEKSGNPTHGSGWMVQASLQRERQPFPVLLSLSPRATRGEKCWWTGGAHRRTIVDDFG